MIWRTITAAVALVSVSTCCASEIQNGKVLSVLAGEQYGNRVFVELDPKPAAPAACQSNPRYSYVFDPTTPVGKVVLGILMTAYASGQDVYVSSWDTCDLYAGVETLKQLQAK